MADTPLDPKPKRKYVRKAVPPMPQPEAVAVADVPKPKVRSRVSIIERRLQSPFGEPTSRIDFKNAALSGRWFNTAIRNGQYNRALDLGWLPVTPDLLVDLHQLGSWTPSPEGAVTRGERGQEVLMYMPLKERVAIQAAKTRENNRLMGNPNAQLRQAAEALGAADPEGGDFLDRHARAGTARAIGGITDSREIIQRDVDPV